MQYYEVYLSFGSNVGDRQANIKNAVTELNIAGVNLKQLSSLYETEPWGNTNQKSFLNMAGTFETLFSPSELMGKILAIENSLGRRREIKWEPRIIDIDILFFENEIINDKRLIIPHPEIEKRKFVLAPLAEIAPDFVHPVLKKSIRELLNECPDELQVAIVTP